MKYTIKKVWNFLNQEIEEVVPSFPTRRSLKNSSIEQSNSPEFIPSTFFQDELTLNNTQTRTAQLRELPQEEFPQEDHQARRLKETIKKPRWKWIIDKHKVAVYLTPLLAQWLVVSYMIQARGRDRSIGRHHRQSHHHSHHHPRRTRRSHHSRDTGPGNFHYRTPPSWNPSEAWRYSFRAWQQDMQIWIHLTDLNVRQQAAAICMALR